MGWFWSFYLTIAVLAFVPRLFLAGDPLFLYAPPPRFWWLRIKALLNPKVGRQGGREGEREGGKGFVAH